MKKLLIRLAALAISAMMLLTLMPGTLMAEEEWIDPAAEWIDPAPEPAPTIVTVNGVGYSDLTSAFAAVQGSQDELILQTDIILANPVTINLPWGAGAKLDLDGHKIRMYDAAENIAGDNSGAEYTGQGGCFILKNGTLSVYDDEYSYELGSITSSNQSQPLFLVNWDDANSGSYLYIYNGKYASSANQDCIRLTDAYGSSEMHNTTEVQVEGGNFNKQLPQEYLVSGYSQTQRLDDYSWDVVEAPPVTTYTVTWYNYDWTPLYSTQVSEGGSADYYGDTPYRPDDGSNTYTFAGWDTETTYITGDTQVMAVFSATPITPTYTVTWYNYDWTPLYMTTVSEGSQADYYGDTPAKPADESNTYTFAGWDTETTYITSDTQVMATFTATPIVYTYTVTWNNWDGTPLYSTQVSGGGAAVYAGETPTRDADYDNTYSFAGWDQSTDAVNSDMTVTAVYTATPIVYTYTVTWNNWDGTPLYSTQVNGGEAAVYAGDTPTRDADYDNTYSFAGWDQSTDVVNSDMTVTAVYTATPIVRYYVTFYVQAEDVAIPDGQIVRENDYAQDPGALSREGYKFTGWYADGAETPFDFANTPITANLDLYAHWEEIQPTEFTVSFTVEEDPESEPPTEYVEEGKTAEDPGPVEIKGFEFEGWYEEGAVEAYDFSAQVYENLDLKAAMREAPEPTTYTLHFDLGRNDVTNKDDFEDLPCVAGKSVILPEINPIVADNVVYFYKWYTDPDLTQEVTEPIVLSDSNMTIYAGWAYQISFSPGEGTGEMDPVLVKLGDKYQLPEHKFSPPEGKTFDKWDAGNTGEEIEVNSNLLIIALWTDPQPEPPVTTQWTVTFYWNGKGPAGTIDEVYDSDSVNDNEYAAAPEIAPSAEGWNFGGWYETDPNTLFDFDGTPITSNTALYAKWTAISPTQYKVTFDMQGHGTPIPEQTVDEGTTPTKPEKDPEESGWTFGGWYKEAGCTNQYDFNAKIYDNTTIYAKWTQNQPVTYTVTFSYNGRGTDPYATATVNDGATVSKPADPSVPGYLFGGWYTDTACTSAFDFNTPIKEYMILYAKWTEAPTVIEKYSVTFYTAHGVTPDGQLVEKNKTVIQPADPVASGYIFEGWYTDIEYTNKYDFNAPVTQNLTIYAKWSEEPTTIQYFTVSFYTERGTVPAAQTVEKGYPVAKPADPTAQGYVFGGWYTDKELTNLYDFNTAVTINMTLFAKWTELPVQYFVVSFNSNGHGNTPNPQTVQSGQLAQKPADPVATGYTFTGWFTDASYTQAYNFNSPVYNDLTLYAGWTPNRYTIKFDSNSGVGTMASISCVYDVKTMLTPNAFTRSGYYFVGWNTAADGSGVLIADRAEVRNLTNVNGATVNLYAQWKNIYNVLEGTNAKVMKGSKDGITFKTDGDYSKFTGIRIDNNNVATSQYTSWAGSTYVQLHADYVNQMTNGEHTIRFMYTDGAVDTKFEIVSGTPKTGDTNNALIWIIIAIAALVIIIVIIILILVRRRNNDYRDPDRGRYADHYGDRDDEFEEDRYDDEYDDRYDDRYDDEPDDRYDDRYDEPDDRYRGRRG